VVPTEEPLKSPEKPGESVDHAIEQVYDWCMLSDLRDEVERLDIPVHGEAIAEAYGVLDLLHAKVVAAVAEYDHEEQAVLDGAHSTTGFLQACGVVRPSLEVKLARRLRVLPVTGAAWRHGSLTTAHVEAIVANVDDATIDQLVDHEGDLVPRLVQLSPRDAASVMRLWKAHADALVDRPDRDGERVAHLSDLLDGRGRLDADLDAEGMALTRRALALAESPDADGEESRTPGRRRGDALVDVMRFFLDHRADTPTSRNRPHVNVVVGSDALSGGVGGELVASGAPLSAAAVQRLLCDADVHRVLTAGRSVILDFGAARRLFSDAQFNALVLRDRHCRWPGCDRPPQWTQAHHVIPFPHGPTSLDNGVLLCDRHHHIVHLPGWTAKLELDGTFHVTAPDERTWTTHAPGVLALG
jgi:hypothetical protein